MERREAPPAWKPFLIPSFQRRRIQNSRFSQKPWSIAKCKKRLRQNFSWHRINSEKEREVSHGDSRNNGNYMEKMETMETTLSRIICRLCSWFIGHYVNPEPTFPTHSKHLEFSTSKGYQRLALPVSFFFPNSFGDSRILNSFDSNRTFCNAFAQEFYRHIVSIISNTSSSMHSYKNARRNCHRQSCISISESD